MIILHSHLRPQFKNELFHILHIIKFIVSNYVKMRLIAPLRLLCYLEC